MSKQGLAIALLLTLGCSKPAAPHAPPVPIRVEAPRPAAAAAAASAPAPTVPPETLYEPDFAALHAGYAETLAQARGKPLAHDAPILAGNALQLHGNSYIVAQVSLMLIDDPPRVFDGEFDPHASPTPAPRAATPDEVARAGEALRSAAPVIRTERAQIHVTAPLPIATTLCTRCHAPDATPPAALLYTFRELADD